MVLARRNGDDEEEKKGLDNEPEVNLGECIVCYHEIQGEVKMCPECS